MPVFKKTIRPISPTEDDTPEPSESPQRPGTSGTELMLTNKRRIASAQYVAAQRAETAYKAKKRSANVRQHRSEALSHFKQSGFHLKEGVKSCGQMIAAVPWMIRNWREKRQTEEEKKSVEKYMEKKKKLEERIAKRKANNEENDDDAESAA